MAHRMPTTLGASSSPGQFPLLTTKLYIPHPRRGLVARLRLLAQVEAALRGPLTLLIAPAGWGKTSLLSAWCAAAAAARDHHASAEPVAWVSLDAGDNDPTHFWTYILTALDMAHPGVANDTLARLRSPQPPPIELVLTLLLNTLDALETDTVLVLDDYHSIQAEAIHASVDFLIDHLPPRCHLVLAAREDPPLPLARRRAQGTVIELRAADLRFTSEEIAEFLTTTLGTPLSDDVVRTLEARSEGWIAGLQLAALSLRGQSRQQAEAFIAAFAGSNRYIVDYLVEEVLARQPPAIQTFLLRTAVVDRFCAPLCEALLADLEDGAAELPDDTSERTSLPPSAHSAQPDAIVSGAAVDADPARASGAALPTTRALHAVLEQVERTNLFLIPLDDERRWYRYHHLFADVLRSRLLQQDPILAAEMHRRASGWFEEQGLVVEAIQQALAAPDATRAAELVEQHGLGFGLAGQVETVLAWIRALPEALVRARPRLCACLAHMLFISGQPAEVVAAPLRDLEAAVDVRRQEDASEAELRLLVGILLTTQALVAIPPGDLGRSVPLAHEAFFELLPETEVMWRLVAMTAAQQAFEVTGDVTRASIREWSRRAATLRARGQIDPAGMLSMDVAHRQRLHGQLRAAAATYEDTMSTIPRPLQIEDLHAGAGCAFGLAHVRLEWNDLSAADHLLSRGMRMLERWAIPARTITQGYVILARLQQARGEYAAALATLDDFEALAERRHFAAVWPARAAAVRAHIQLAQGDLAAATRWAEASGLSSDDTMLEFLREREYLTLVRVRIAQARGDPAGPYLGAALHLLDLIQHDAEPKERLSSVLETLILRALAHQAHRDRRGALGALAQALTLAAPEGYVRLFADEGAPLATLLTDLIKTVEQRRLNVPAAVMGYARGLVAICRSPEDGSVPAPALQAAQTQRMMEGNTGEPQHRSLDLAPGVPPLLDPLTERELEVLRLLAEGASNAAIAAALVVVVGTVKKHVYNICAKLGAQNRTQAVARARALRLL